MSFNFGSQNDGAGQGGLSLPGNNQLIIRLAIVLSILIGVIVLGSFMRSVFTNWLWFDGLGYTDVYRTVLVAKLLLFVVGCLSMIAITFLSIFVTYKIAKDKDNSSNSTQNATINPKLILLLGFGVATLGSIIFGLMVAGKWQEVLSFLNSTSFGIFDPLFNRDVGFYVFTFPVIKLLQGYLLGIVIFSTLISAGIYYVLFSMQGLVLSEMMSKKTFTHASVIGAIILAILIWGYWLNLFDLLRSDAGPIVGASYSDIYARMPALRILMVITAASSIMLLINGFKFRKLRVAIGAVGLWLVASIILLQAYPNMIQQFQVKPQELTKETEYIERNIQFTREAFGLGNVEERDHAFTGVGITSDILNNNTDTIDNIRLWDHRPLRDTLNQIQFFRPYYEFSDVDVDRYDIDGRTRQVMLSARELTPEKLDPSSQRWVNQKLQYTHGYGATMSPVTEFTSDGRPTFFLKDIPPTSTVSEESDVGLEGTGSQIYYGERTSDYVIVDTNQEEFDYPTETGIGKSTTYAGSGGVEVGSFLRKLVYSWEFRDVNILISSELTSDSQIQYRREIQERISTVAPFLHLDEDPYLVDVGGKLWWMQDAYTSTDLYPYSEPYEDEISSFNYIRNSVKIVIDAYEGDVHFYMMDPEDPIAMTFSKIFPNLFKDADSMPANLKEHIRYPEGLFSIQSEKYLRYHVKDPKTFFLGEDQWSIPMELFLNGQQKMEPYYLIMRLPGEKKEEFILLTPFTPFSSPNMVAWLAARSDNPHYGDLMVFMFPRGLQVDGPFQVEARIDNDPIISPQLTLLCETGSECIRGNLLVIPLENGEENSVLYVEPLYLRAETLQFPELKRVLAADSSSVVMAPTLDEALRLLSDARVGCENGGDNCSAIAKEKVSHSGVGNVAEEIERLQKVLDGLKSTVSQLEEGFKSLRGVVEKE